MASVLGYLEDAACIVCLQTGGRLYGHVDGPDHAACEDCLRSLQATPLQGKCPDPYCQAPIDFSTLFSQSELQERTNHFRSERLVDRIDTLRMDANMAQELEDNQFAASLQQLPAGRFVNTSNDAAIARVLSEGVEISCTTVALSVVALALALLGAKEVASKISS